MKNPARMYLHSLDRVDFLLRGFGLRRKIGTVAGFWLVLIYERYEGFLGPISVPCQRSVRVLSSEGPFARRAFGWDNVPVQCIFSPFCRCAAPLNSPLTDRPPSL